MNNVLAAGGRAPTLTASSNVPAPCLTTKPPSPTAVAINLLNLLKIANTMYNPFGPGNQIPPQGPYGLSGGLTGMDPRRPPPQFGPGSSFSSSGSSSANHGPSGGPLPSPLSLPAKCIPERNKITVDEDIERCLDLHISRAREEAMQTSSSQSSQFSIPQRDTFPSSNTGRPSYLTPPANPAKRPFPVDSSTSSLDWLPICQRGSEEASKKYPSHPSIYLSSGDGNFSKEKHNKSSIPGLGDYDMKVPAKIAPPSVAARPKYTSESASSILQHFGLEKEDLEQLISFPEDQITPENLPFILRQIQLEKGKRGPTAVQSSPYGATQPMRSMTETDSLIPSRGAVMTPVQTSSTVLKPSTVIDYGHTGKYTTGVGNEAGRLTGSSAMTSVSGGLLHTNTFKPGSHEQNPPQRGQAELKAISSVSSHGQLSSVSNVDTLRSSVALSSGDPAKKPGVQAKQTSESIFQSFGLPNKDTDLRRAKSEVPKAPPPKQPEPAHQAPPQTQPPNPSCSLVHGFDPYRPGLVLIQRTKFQQQKKQTEGQGPKAPKQTNMPPAQQHQPPPLPKPQLPMHLQPLKQAPQTTGLPAAIPTMLGHVPVRPALQMPAPGRMDAVPHVPPPPFKDQKQVPKMGTLKLPTPAMMQDYAAATPRIFPHTCCLCMKECTNMKDWLSHQNTSLHLESCTLLRGRYPDWDGNTLDLLSGQGKGSQPSPSSFGQNVQNRHQKSTHETRSHSLSPHRKHVSEDRKEKQLSRSPSRSPHHHYGSESRRQKRSSRSRSRSPNRYFASEGQRERRSSRSPYASRHSRRSRSRSYDRSTSSRHRSRSRSYERRSPPRKREAKRSSPRRSYEHRSPQRRSHDRRSPSERSASQHKRSSSADRLAKRLLETSAVQSLSKQSDLEAMVKTLAPALLAELAKLRSSSSSSTEKTASSTKSPKATTSHAKSGTSSSPNPALTESLSPDKVRLCNVSSQLSHGAVFEATEKFGKVRNIFMFRHKLQAVVQFEKVEDAEKLRSLKDIQVKGSTVCVKKITSVASKKPQSTKVETSASQKKSAEASTQSTPAGKDETPKLVWAKKATAGKLINKGKGIATKQAAVTKSNTVGKAPVKTQGSVAQNPQSPEKMIKAADSKGKTTDTKPESAERKSTEAVKATKESNLTVADDNKGKSTASEVKDLTPEAKTSSNTEEAETQPDTLTVEDLVSKSAPLENPLVAARTEVEQATLVPENTAEIMNTVETSERKQVEECAKVEDVESSKTGPAKSLEVMTSESKDQVVDTLTQPAKSQPAAGVKTPPCSSPPKSSTDPPQTSQTPVKDEKMSGNDSSLVQLPPTEEAESTAGKLKRKTEQKLSPRKTDTTQEGMRSHQSPETVSNVLAVKLEEPAAADGAAAAADVPSVTVGAKAGKQVQQDEKKSPSMETFPSSLPLSEDSNTEERPTPQTCPSVSPNPAVSAEPIQLDSVKARSTASDMKAGENELRVVATSTVFSKSNENAEKKRSPRAPTKQTMPAPSTTSNTTSRTVSDKPEEKAAVLPRIDEDVFRAITTALREHRERKERTTTSEECATISKSYEDTKEKKHTSLTEDVSEDEDPFEFNFGDFVTVDEIGEEMDDAPVEDAFSSLESVSSDITDGESGDVRSAKKTSTRSSKESKRSASSPSKSDRDSVPLSSRSISANKKKPSPEPIISEIKRPSASSIKTSSPKSSKSIEPLPSSGQKAQSNKRKPPVQSNEPLSSGRSTRSSASASKSSIETQQMHNKDVKPKESAVAKSDHRVSADTCVTNTVESELRTKPPEKDQCAAVQISQIQNLETDVKNETVKGMKRRNAKGKKIDMDGKTTEGKRSKDENDQIVDSLNQKPDEQKNKEDNQDRRTDTQIPGHEKDQIFPKEGLQVVESADNVKACSDEGHEMEIDESTKLQVVAVGYPKDAATTVDGDHETRGALSAEGSSVRTTSDRNRVTNEDASQTPNSCGAKANVHQKDEKVLLKEVCEISKDVGQISNEEHHGDSKDTSKDHQLVVPTDLQSKADVESTEEEVYQVIDSLEDQPTTATTETVSETEKKEETEKESTTTSGDYRLTRKSRSRSRTSKSEEKEKSPKQDKTIRKYATRIKDSKTKEEDKTLEDFEEMVYEVVDAIEEDSVPETSTAESSGRRRSARGNKNYEKASAPGEELKKSKKEEEMFTVLDYVEEEDPSDKPVRRSTRGRRESTAKTVEENTKTKEDKALPRRKRTSARDSQEKDREKTPKIDVPLKEMTPMKKSDTRNLGEEETAYEILDAVEEEVVGSTTQYSKRGGPKRDDKTSKKQPEDLKVGPPIEVVGEEEEEEATFQILDSVEEEMVDVIPVDQSEDAKTLSVSADDDMSTEIIKSLLNQEEEEPIYQVVDSLEEDQFQEETMAETPREGSETTDDMAPNTGTNHVLSGLSTEEPSEQKGGEEEILPQVVKLLEDKEDLFLKGSDDQSESTSKADIKVEDKSLNKPTIHFSTPEGNVLKSPKTGDTKANKDVLVNLDQVSEEEEDYPDDTAEEEELNKRQAAAKRREKDRGERKSRETETRERRSRSSSRGSGSKPRTKRQKRQEDLEKVVVDTQDLVTLDEVGEDETGEEGVSEAPAWDGELTEGELQDLVTVDEIAEEEEGKEDDGKIEALTQSQEVQSGSALKPKTMSVLTEIIQIEQIKDDNKDPEEPPSSSKDQGTTEESENFVTVDEVGEIEEEEEKEAGKAKGRPRRRWRRRKRRAEEAAPTEDQPRPEGPGGLKLGSEEVEQQEQSRIIVKPVNKRKQELIGPKAKRSRSQSPSVSSSFPLPPFHPKKPLGKEFVNPTSGFFCSLCSVFYLNESTAMEIHCSSQEHYNNLLNHYQRLQQGAQGSLSD